MSRTVLRTQSGEVECLCPNRHGPVVTGETAMGTVPCSVCQNVLSGFWLRISSLSGSPEQARARLAADWSACNKEQLWSRSSVAPQRSTNWYVRQHCCCAVGFWSYGNELEEGRFFVLFDGGWMMGDCWEASACGGGVQTEVTTPAQYEARRAW